MTVATEEIASHIREIVYEIIPAPYPHDYLITSAPDIHALMSADWDYGKPDASVAFKVCLGGYAGGNCWGGKPTRFEEPGAEDLDFDLLDTFLEACVPDASFADARALRKMVATSQRTHSEYYGNSTDIRYFFLPLAPVADLLNARSLFVRPPEFPEDARPR